MDKDSPLVIKTVRTARILFFGIAMQATVFAFWGMQFFLSEGVPSAGGVGIYFIFGGMAVLSFAYGVRFFQNYTRVKREQIMKHPEPKRKETLLLISAIHFLLLEFVTIIGIVMAIFVQQKYIIYPFYGLFVIGFAFSYPRPEWYRGFFKDTNGPATI